MLKASVISWQEMVKKIMFSETISYNSNMDCVSGVLNLSALDIDRCCHKKNRIYANPSEL